MKSRRERSKCIACELARRSSHPAPNASAARLEAMARGERRYFTGEECKNGHIAERLVSDNGCVECRKDISRRHNAKRSISARGRINNGVRARIHKSLRARGGNKRNRPWESLVGYTVAELKLHIERQFRRGMSWKNYGKRWHIDHIRPLSSFDFKSPDDASFREAWALTNLQPLWAGDNQTKYAHRTHLI